MGLVVSAWLFALCVVVQVFLAGLSTFDSSERWSDHASFGQMIGTLTILLVVLALVGRLPRLTIVFSIVVFVLYGLQFPFANTDAGPLAALHVVNALALFWITVHVAQQATRLTFPASSR
jgi:hypothetical protein